MPTREEEERITYAMLFCTAIKLTNPQCKRISQQNSTTTQKSKIDHKNSYELIVLVANF